jgi:hypothetical protein
MTTTFEWHPLDSGNGTATAVAFIRTGALVRCIEWDSGDSQEISPSVAVVFIPGATRADFFKDEP